MLRCRRLPRLLLLIAAVVSIGAVGACATDDVPEVPVAADGSVDPVLVDGRRIYIDRCANCHGNDGGGGRGTKLSDGLMTRRYPDIDEQARIVADGVRAMPAFDEVLDAAQILAVVRYTREVL
ncbi:MAG: cytochrome c [Acidimicrobiaceae bacterium]|nr:cytochrome c [Acidimicrobiaceae bacterium]